jgi:hypothetical protein
LEARVEDEREHSGEERGRGGGTTEGEEVLVNDGVDVVGDKGDVRVGPVGRIEGGGGREVLGGTEVFFDKRCLVASLGVPEKK